MANSEEVSEDRFGFKYILDDNTLKADASTIVKMELGQLGNCWK